MRKIILFLSIFALIVSCCSPVMAEKEATETTSKDDLSATSSKILVVYFSRAGENYNVGTVSEGNTSKLAKEIAKQTGGELFEIVPVVAYPESYDEMLEVATREESNEERPEIRDTIEDFDAYDIVFLGYPIWWGGLPMILHSFMESYDFTGKTIIPFNTHEGSGQAGTQEVIASKLADATVLQGFAMKGSKAQELKSDGTNEDVSTWLESLEINIQEAPIEP